MHLFKIRTFVVVVIVGSVGQMVYFALNVLWPQQITALYTTDNMKIGAISVSGFFQTWMVLLPNPTADVYFRDSAQQVLL